MGNLVYGMTAQQFLNQQGQMKSISPQVLDYDVNGVCPLGQKINPALGGYCRSSNEFNILFFIFEDSGDTQKVRA